MCTTRRHPISTSQLICEMANDFHSSLVMQHNASKILALKAWNADCWCVTISSVYLVVWFEVFTAVTMKNSVFWDMVPCRSCVNWHFGGTSVHKISTRRHIPEYGIIHQPFRSNRVVQKDVSRIGGTVLRCLNIRTFWKLVVSSMLLFVYLWERARSNHWTAGIDMKLVKWSYILSDMIFSNFKQFWN
jgi:hypothetical protein